MSIDRLTREIVTFCTERDWDQFHGLKDLAIGASTESAELLELFRFKNDEEVNELLKSSEFRHQLSDELADVLFFVLRLAERSGINIEEAFQQKMQKNAAKYPVDKAKGSNRKYTEMK